MSSRLRKMSKGQTSQPHTQANAGLVEISSQKQFEKLLGDQSKPLIVDFWAPWCGPCKAMAPVFAQVAKEQGKDVRFAKLDTEAVPSVARALQITSIPTLLVFDGGEVIDTKIGLSSASQLRALAKRALDKHNRVGFTDKVKRLFGKSEHQTAMASDHQQTPA